MSQNARMHVSARLVSLGFVLLSLGCDDDHNHDHDHQGIATQSVCPATAPPTYESFGAAFMQSYCVQCHSSELTGAARNGAPLDHDFDTLEGVLAQLEHIDEYAAAGPAGANEKMPPLGPAPTAEERLELGAWLACLREEHADHDAGDAHHHHE